jgi:hypothetical protein
MMGESMRTTRNTPLWPAGHLPLKGGDWQAASALPDNTRRRPPLCPATLVVAADSCPDPISPLEGEMAGRPEGGNSSRRLQSFAQTIRQEAIHAPRS